MAMAWSVIWVPSLVMDHNVCRGAGQRLDAGQVPRRPRPDHNGAVDPALLTAFVLVALVAMASAWVLADARTRKVQGQEVRVRLFDWTIERPETWAVLTLFAGVFFLPLYLVARGSRT